MYQIQKQVPASIIYPVSLDPYSIQVSHPRVCKDEAHWLVVKLVIPGPMSFVLTYSGMPYLDTLGVYANWIDYSTVLQNWLNTVRKCAISSLWFVNCRKCVIMCKNARN